MNRCSNGSISSSSLMSIRASLTASVIPAALHPFLIINLPGSVLQRVLIIHHCRACSNRTVSLYFLRPSTWLSILWEGGKKASCQITSCPSQVKWVKGGLEICCSVIVTWRSKEGLSRLKTFIESTYSIEKNETDDSKNIIKEITAKIRINLCLDEQVEDTDRAR